MMIAFSSTVKVAALSTSTFFRRTSSRHCFKNVDKQMSFMKRLHWSEYYKGSTGVFMSATEETAPSKTLESTWNIGGLKKEVSRLTVRCHKKIGKANQRLTKANQEVDRLTSDPNVSMEELEACPNIDGLENDLGELRERLRKLNKLEVLIEDLKGKKVVLDDHIAEIAIKLRVNDESPVRQARPKKKEKGPRTMSPFRLPYRKYYTNNKTEIRVRLLWSFYHCESISNR
jgi:hypothetical protein